MNKDQSYKTSHILTVFLLLSGMLLVISASIAVPILIRPLYYLQMDAQHLTEVPIRLADGTRTLTRAEIIQAYDEMMDFCTGRTAVFSTGILAFSEEGRQHFVDVRGLFLLDLWVLGISGTIILGWGLLRKVIPLRTVRWKGKNVGFWSGILLLGVFAVLGILGAIDFDKFFTAFHHLFFPGKTNWVFDPRYDQIIKILPEEVFMMFALMIVCLILLSCGILIWQGIKKPRR